MKNSRVAKLALTGTAAALIAGSVLAPVAIADSKGGSDRPGMSMSKQDRPGKDRPKPDRPGPKQDRPGGAVENGKGKGIGLLFKKLGITKEQASAIKDAYKEQAGIALDEARAAALAGLVAAGVISQPQADAVAAAGKGGVPALVKEGILTREQAAAIWNAMESVKPARDGAVRKAALAGLVADGVITQPQADAIIAWHEKNGWGAEDRPSSGKPTKPMPSGDDSFEGSEHDGDSKTDSSDDSSDKPEADDDDAEIASDNKF